MIFFGFSSSLASTPWLRLFAKFMPFSGTVIHWFFSCFPARSQASRRTAFAQRSFYTKTCLHKTVVRQNNVYIWFLHKTALPQHSFYMNRRYATPILHKEPFIYTARLVQHAEGFRTSGCFCQIHLCLYVRFLVLRRSFSGQMARGKHGRMRAWKKNMWWGKIEIWMELWFFFKPMIQCSKTKFNHPQDCKTSFGLCRRPTSARWNMTQAGDLQIFAVADSFMMVMYRGIIWCVQIGSQNEWFTCK